jgi:hypothetical protein
MDEDSASRVSTIEPFGFGVLNTSGKLIASCFQPAHADATIIDCGA